MAKQLMLSDSVSGGTSRTFEDIARRVRADVSSGRLKPGDKLPPERQLAEQLGVGRNALREALRSLENAGVVELRKGRGGGAFILPHDATRITHAMQDLHDVGSFSLSELTEARITVVMQIVQLACERATEEDFEALAQNIREMEAFKRAGQMDERALRVTDFYRILAQSTGNRVLVLLDSSLTEIIRRFVDLAWQGGNPQLLTLGASRRRFLKHLRARDAVMASQELNRQLLDLHETLARTLPPAAKAPAEAARRRDTA